MCKKHEKAYFDQCLQCAAPKYWSKYTTSTDSLQVLFTIKMFLFASSNNTEINNFLGQIGLSYLYFALIVANLITKGAKS